MDPGRSWDERYQGNNRIWGENPSELAVITVEYLQTVGLDDEDLRILEIGCGYGRDAVYFSERLNCRILGIDISGEVIRMAQDACPEESRVEFRCCDFAEAIGGEYDVVFVSNLYHLLRRDERQRLRETVAGLLKPGGLLFLGALSTNDRQDYGEGIPVLDEPGSFEGKRYRHFCTQDELLEDFSFLTIRQLYEYEYDEPHASGETHHHISWIVVGERDAHLR